MLRKKNKQTILYVQIISDFSISVGLCIFHYPKRISCGIISVMKFYFQNFKKKLGPKSEITPKVHKTDVRVENEISYFVFENYGNRKFTK